MCNLPALTFRLWFSWVLHYTRSEVGIRKLSLWLFTNEADLIKRKTDFKRFNAGDRLQHQLLVISCSVCILRMYPQVVVPKKTDHPWMSQQTKRLHNSIFSMSNSDLSLYHVKNLNLSVKTLVYIPSCSKHLMVFRDLNQFSLYRV